MTDCPRCGQKMETNKRQQLYECTNQACTAKLPILTIDLYRYYKGTIPRIDKNGKKRYTRKGIRGKRSEKK